MSCHAGARIAVLAQQRCHGMRHLIHAGSLPAQPERHMRHLQGAKRAASQQPFYKIHSPMTAALSTGGAAITVRRQTEHKPRQTEHKPSKQSTPRRAGSLLAASPAPPHLPPPNSPQPRRTKPSLDRHKAADAAAAAATAAAVAALIRAGRGQKKTVEYPRRTPTGHYNAHNAIG